ncbi:MAG: PepSY domain-containing protein [Acetobacteraceae bacterium]|nr:PepSY domain-containing protein [Acetobacteraceae bacterium]MCX7685960.1 PepSY domain-containing protein [Acetobacteraceae bacterium]MDW8397729.1 PepSY domain-containing protein [Acetobacteraceae bacterium]
MSATRRSLFRLGSRAGLGQGADGPPPITLGRAVEIARTQGLVRATEAVCDERAWDIEGFDASGREIEVEIDPRSGRVLRVARGG